MMDFITIPLVTGMVVLGIYKLFELFVRKKERLMIIDKIGDKLDSSVLSDQISVPVRIFNRFSSGTLKAGCLLIGVGLGLLVGFLISGNMVPNYNSGGDNWELRETAGMVYGASVLLFGGAGLLVAFLMEMKYAKKLNQ